MTDTKSNYGISDEAVKKATGKSWAQWFSLLDKAGAKDWPHKQIAQFLQENNYIKKGKEWPANRSFSEGWWGQSVTVGYEYQIGRRIKGQTKDSGFEIGVQKTLSMLPYEVWKLITSSKGVKVWLGETGELKFKPGERYQTKHGISGEIRTVRVSERMRLTWQPTGWDKPSTLQIYLTPATTGTSVLFHQEKLSDAKTRAKMKQHWQAVLNKLSQHA
jgi:uncharacterized protein YndB with AHSA1/START domain